MTTTNVATTARLRWMMTGVTIGVLGLAAALGIRGLVGDGSETTMEPPVPMDMSDGAGGIEGGMAMSPTDGVRVTPRQVQQFGITFTTVEERTLEARVRTVGVVKADETRLVDVTTKFPGYVEHLYADFTGTSVAAGSRLLDVYSPELVAAQEEVLLARELQASVGVVTLPGVTTAPIDLEATARRRLSLWDITEDQITTLLADGVPSRALSLRAPIAGVVLEKSVVAGGAFEAGQTLFRLADLSTVWIDVEIRESEAAQVAPGATALATMTAYPGQSFPGAIDFIYPTVDDRTRSVRARVVLPNPSGRLRPGMFATVLVTTPARAALSVASDALVWTGERTLLFVVQEDGGIHPVDVEIGVTMGDHTVVLSGASIGQRVVSSAQYLIDAEANIGAIMRSMMSMMGAGDVTGMDMSDMSDMDSAQSEGMTMPPDSGTGPTPQGR